MHKKEILKLRALSEKDGYTLIPLSLYFKKGRVKVEVGVCRGKKLYDKRESALKRDLERENRRGIKLSDRWSVRWTGTFNIEQEELQYHTGGVYYNHPCYYISAQYRRDNARKNDYVGTTTFQFKFGMAIDGQQY
jgi:hypothetical protein